jgi:hypothetical protein
MIRGQINIRALRLDILAASQDCVVGSSLHLMTLSGDDAETVAATVESRGFTRSQTNDDGSVEFAVVTFE